MAPCRRRLRFQRSQRTDDGLLPASVQRSQQTADGLSPTSCSPAKQIARASIPFYEGACGKLTK